MLAENPMGDILETLAIMLAVVFAGLALASAWLLMWGNPLLGVTAYSLARFVLSLSALFALLSLINET